MESITIRQHTKLLFKSCWTCPPCAPQENTYSIYAGLTKDAEAEFLRVDEVSDDWNRCCCKPYHPLRLEVRQYIPVPGDGSKSDFAHLRQDFMTDFGGFKAARKAQALRELYMQQPVLFSMVRNDGMRCCCKCPCKWLDTVVCFKCCQDGVNVYAGSLKDEPGASRVLYLRQSSRLLTFLPHFSAQTRREVVLTTWMTQSWWDRLSSLIMAAGSAPPSTCAVKARRRMLSLLPRSRALCASAAGLSCAATSSSSCLSSCLPPRLVTWP